VRRSARSTCTAANFPAASVSRLALLPRQSAGVSSQADGHIEIMLHRRTTMDDYKGQLVSGARAKAHKRVPLPQD
jgi:hypothetical protein